jgi:DNA-binding CsgD family transcriptional regulator
MSISPHRRILTDSEKEVLSLIAQGMAQKEIAAVLSISPHTVANHVFNMRYALGALNTLQAVARRG